MANSNWRVSVSEDPQDIARLVGVDRADLERSPFQRAQWLETWFGAFAQPAEARVFAASIENAETGEPVFVLPLRVESRGGIVRLEAWDGGVSDYNAPVLSKSFAPSADDMRHLWSDLLGALPRADVIELEKVPSIVGSIGNPLLEVDGVVTSRFTRHPLPLPQDGDFEALRAARFDPSHRRSLAKKRRKLQNKGRLEFALLGGVDALPTLDLILGWRGERFGEKNQPEEMRRVDAFYRALCGHTDIARVGRLTLDGRIIAGCFGTLTEGTFQLLAVAHDGAFKNWSPGLLAIESSIALMCAQGVTVYDFTIGDEPYKLDFGVDNEKLYALRAGLTWKGCLYLRSRTAFRRLRDWWRERRAKGAATPTPVEPAGEAEAA
ncbi:MAG: GNAT family N-acetyltransferase [Hyphomicrobiales bacterium]|nr:GNAT family N-acetyltransferase [Hyphomicrobiales bacterium]